MAHDLIDEYRLWVFPVVIGKGKRLSADGAVPRRLELVDNVVSSAGVVIGTYRPAGELVTGSIALE
jgi:dihydrofolate reductase